MGLGSLCLSESTRTFSPKAVLKHWVDHHFQRPTGPVRRIPEARISAGVSNAGLKVLYYGTKSEDTNRRESASAASTRFSEFVRARGRFGGQGHTLVPLLAPVHTVTRSPLGDGPPWDWEENPEARLPREDVRLPPTRCCRPSVLWRRILAGSREAPSVPRHLLVWTKEGVRDYEPSSGRKRKSD